MNERTFHANNAKMLDNPERRTWLPPDQVIAKIGIRQNAVVADIGAGTGYFAFPFAEVVGPGGKILAVDFQPAMLETIRSKLETRERVSNIEIVSGSAAATNLQARSVDIVFMANLWHELDELPSVLVEAGRILRPAGRLAIVDWRADMSSPPGPPDAHRVGLDSVLHNLESHGWNVVDSGLVGSYSHYVVAQLEAGRM